jgi:hypothetical protein
MARLWLLWIDSSAWRYVKAEAPCWKGEIQAGRLVIGWQRRREQFMLSVFHCTAHMRLTEPPPDCLACKRSLDWPKQSARDAALRRGVERLRDRYLGSYQRGALTNKDSVWKIFALELDALLRAGEETK